MVDNGYLRWSTTIPPFKSAIDRDQLRWSEWLESMRKDVECTFGILKGRFRILKTGIRLHKIEAVDKILLTCCALHNLLLETAYKATRQVDIRCLCCLELSPDEARILATLSYLQHGRPAAAVTHLEQWFADVSIQRVLTYSAQMRHSLKSLDNPLPLRQWDFEGMLQRQVLFEHGRTGTHLVSVH